MEVIFDPPLGLEETDNVFGLENVSLAFSYLPIDEEEDGIEIDVDEDEDGGEDEDEGDD